jgi:hypothetical protein
MKVLFYFLKFKPSYGNFNLLLLLLVAAARIPDEISP